MNRKPKKQPSVAILECTRCGESKTETEFYSNKWSKVYSAQKRVPLCKDCVQALFNDYSDEYGEEVAVFLICAALDIPFDNRLISSTKNKTPPFTVGKYYRQLQLSRYTDKSFAESVTTGGQKCPKVQGANDRLAAIQDDISAMHEELHDLRDRLIETGNAHE